MDIASIVASGLLGSAAGAAIAYLYTDRKAKAALALNQTELALAQQKSLTLQQDLDSARAQLSQEQSQSAALQSHLATAQTHSAALAAQLAASEKNITEQKTLLDDAQQKLTDAFATVSQSALARSNEAFIQMAEAKFKILSTEAQGDLNERRAQISTLLKPLEENLLNYQKRLAELEATRTNAYGELLKQIGSMSNIQQTLSQQTAQLVTALKKSSVRGRWGEIALQRLAEMAGMTEHVDFLQQESVRNDEGRLLRPDMTVYLPGNRCVVVDSKAVMNAFLDGLAVNDEATKSQLMQTHAKNVRSRIDELAGKAYWNQFDTAPECVVLFLPGESFLYAACDADPEIVQYAITKRVLLATPTTFISLLLTIEHGWRQEALSKNAETIRDLGKQIYERLIVFTTQMASVGKSLDNALDHYNKAAFTLDERVLVPARKISELGAGNGNDLAELPQVEKRARKLHPTLFAE